MLVSWCLEPSQPQRVISGLMTERRMTTCLKRWRSVAGGFCLQHRCPLCHRGQPSHLLSFSFLLHSPACSYDHRVGILPSCCTFPGFSTILGCCFLCANVFDVSLLCSLPGAISQQLQLLRHQLPLWPHRQPLAQRWKKNIMKHDCR